MICKCTYIHSMEGARTPETHYVPDCMACMLTHTRVETGFLVHWIVGVGAQEEAQVGRQTNIRTSLHQETLEESTTHSDR